MYIHELITFISVADKGSFLKASNELYLTPASIMNQVNKLESLVGVKLIERTNQGCHLTDAGKAIYKDAKKIIKLSDQAIAHARMIAEAKEQAIRVGTSILRPCKALVDLWRELDDSVSPIRIHIIPFDDSPSSMNLMLDSIGREIDCFVGPCDSITWRERYNIFAMAPIDCCIALNRSHRLSKKEKLTWNDLDGETIMLVKRGTRLYLTGCVMKSKRIIQRSLSSIPRTFMIPASSMNAKRMDASWKPLLSGKMSILPS